MIFTGAAFLIDWLLMQVFSLDVIKATLVTAIILIVAGVLIGSCHGYRPWVVRR